MLLFLDGSSSAKDNVIEFAQVSLLLKFVLRPIIYRLLIFKFRAVCQILEAACVSGWVGRGGGGKKSVKSWGKKVDDECPGGLFELRY